MAFRDKHSWSQIWYWMTVLRYVCLDHCCQKGKTVMKYSFLCVCDGWESWLFLVACMDRSIIQRAHTVPIVKPSLVHVRSGWRGMAASQIKTRAANRKQGSKPKTVWKLHDWAVVTGVWSHLLNFFFLLSTSNCFLSLMWFRLLFFLLFSTSLFVNCNQVLSSKIYKIIFSKNSFQTLASSVCWCDEIISFRSFERTSCSTALRASGFISDLHFHRFLGKYSTPLTV